MINSGNGNAPQYYVTVHCLSWSEFQATVICPLALPVWAAIGIISKWRLVTVSCKKKKEIPVARNGTAKWRRIVLRLKLGHMTYQVMSFFVLQSVAGVGSYTSSRSPTLGGSLGKSRIFF